MTRRSMPAPAWLAGLLALGAPPAAAADPPIALVGATVYLPDGPHAGVVVTVADGHVIALGDAPPAGATIVDVAGQVITPGLIAADSRLGVNEIELEDATVDDDAGGDARVRAAFRVADAYNPRSPTIAVARMGGVTSAVTAPTGGLVSGQGAFVTLAGATQREAVVDPAIGLYVNLGGGESSRALALHQLEQSLNDARLLLDRGPDVERGETRPLSASYFDLAALAPVLRGELPVVARVERAADIEAVVALAERWKLRLIVEGGSEAWVVADLLAARGVPVILDPTVYGPGSFDQVLAREDGAARLAAAGVTVVLAASASGDTHRLGRTRQVAGNAVRGGMDHDAAVRAITQTPADALGMVGYGRIEVGAIADLVVWTGDPLEIATQASRVYVHGVEMPLRSRQTLLLERYRELPGTPEPLPLP